jgi:regulator of sigma E protease
VELPLIVVILEVALGLGAVIFIHELGHFLAAKWAGVKVERFSVGFPMPNAGPTAIWFCALAAVLIGAIRSGEIDPARLATWAAMGAAVGAVAMFIGKWGSVRFHTDADGTEYVLGFLPLGGYVKMLGQDDADPSSMTNQKILQDPRSYPAQPVYKRMVIISAGVVMNVIFAFVVFVVAFRIGVEYQPCVVQYVAPASPAWLAQIHPGDEIVQINNRKSPKFNDLRIAVALSGPDEVMHLKVRRPGRAELLDVNVVPLLEKGGPVPQIGVKETASLRLQKKDPTMKGFPAAEAKPPFEGGDRIAAVDGVAVTDFVQLQAELARKADAKQIVFTVERKGPDQGTHRHDIDVGRTPFRTLGLHMRMGPIVAVQPDSPAAEAGLQVGDLLLAVDAEQLGTQLDPLHLPDLLFQKAGKTVELTVQRSGKTLPPLAVTPRPWSAWQGVAQNPKQPLGAPALGIAYHMPPEVVFVEPGSPAEKAAIQAGDTLTQMQILETKTSDHEAGPVFLKPLEFDNEDQKNWAFAASFIQTEPTDAEIELTFAGREPVRLRAQPDPGWFIPLRGMKMQLLTRELQIKNVLTAARWGVRETWDRILQVYLMLRGMVIGRISPDMLGGPITIAAAAGAKAQEGPGELLMILGIISANLAVINFFPIPVLDGGHMAFLVWEAVAGKPPSERVLVIANYVGLLLIACLMLGVLYLDIVVHRRLG